MFQLIGYSIKTGSRRTPLFYDMQYREDIISREFKLYENCPVGSENQTHNIPNSCNTCIYNRFVNHCHDEWRGMAGWGVEEHSDGLSACIYLMFMNGVPHIYNV